MHVCCTRYITVCRGRDVSIRCSIWYCIHLMFFIIMSAPSSNLSAQKQRSWSFCVATLQNWACWTMTAYSSIHQLLLLPAFFWPGSQSAQLPVLGTWRCKGTRNTRSLISSLASWWYTNCSWMDIRAWKKTPSKSSIMIASLSMCRQWIHLKISLCVSSRTSDSERPKCSCNIFCRLCRNYK